MDNFVLFNTSEENGKYASTETKTHHQVTSEDTKCDDPLVKHFKKEAGKVCKPYCVFNLTYENHSYIPRGRVLAFAEKEDGEENELFEVEEINSQEEYRNWY